MTLDETIKHAEKVAELCEDSASRYDMNDHLESYMAYQDGKCAEEHKQLAEWLKELKRLREQTEPEKCGDCISREAARNALLNKGQHSKRYKLGETWELNLMEIEETLWELPPVEPERKPGHWEYVQYDGNPKIGNWHCSNCRLIVNLGFEGAPYYHYCPNCGAKMEVDTP